MAGGLVVQTNNQYYLYNGQYYWTMSPYQWYSGSINNANVFRVYSDGSFSNVNVNSSSGLRPVINLAPGTVFNTGGNGTQNNPYVIS